MANHVAKLTTIRYTLLAPFMLVLIFFAAFQALMLGITATHGGDLLFGHSGTDLANTIAVTEVLFRQTIAPETEDLINLEFDNFAEDGIFLSILLFVMMKAISSLEAPFFGLHWSGVLEGEFNFAAIVFLLGGVFIMYTAVKEIMHLLSVPDIEHEKKSGRKTAAQAVTMIVIMNLVFSFDSILSAMAITMVFGVLAVAIISVLIFNFLSAKFDKLDMSMQHAAGELLDHLEANDGRSA